MTLQTWMDEYYPTIADDFSEGDDLLAAVNHSLKKWEGLRADNLKKHDLYRHGGGIYHNEIGLGIDSSTCALCQFYDCDCLACIIAELRDGVSCDVDADALNESNSPYHEFTRGGNPEPMIQLLMKAKEQLESECVG